jgi:hypothetical protein
MKKVSIILTVALVCICAFSCKKKSENTDTAMAGRIISGDFWWNYGFECLCKTSDNNIAIVSTKGASHQLYVAMLNSGLDILWERTFDTDVDNAGGIAATEDGGLVIASNHHIVTTDMDTGHWINLRRLNSRGDLVWAKKYVFKSYGLEYYPILRTPDNGYILDVTNSLPGDERYYPTLFKISPQGDSIWSKSIPGLFNSHGSDIHLASDGGYFICGNCSLCRTDSLGNLKWHNADTYSSTTCQILQDDSIAVLVKNWDWGYPGIIMVDKNGGTVWSKWHYNEDVENVANLCFSNGNGFVFTQDNYSLFKLIKTDRIGNKLSETNILGSSANGLIQYQNKYCYFSSRGNSSTKHMDLIIQMLN